MYRLKEAWLDVWDWCRSRSSIDWTAILRIFKCIDSERSWVWVWRRNGRKISKQQLQTHTDTQAHTRLHHTPVLHTHTHTSAPSNNPLILFIISQLLSVRTIHERNHTHKHTPMCRAEIQYKYTHLYFLISFSIFTPFCYFPLCYVMHQLCSYTSQSHINAQPLRNAVCSSFLCLKSFAKLWRARVFPLPLIGFFFITRRKHIKILRFPCERREDWKSSAVVLDQIYF